VVKKAIERERENDIMEKHQERMTNLDRDLQRHCRELGMPSILDPGTLKDIEDDQSGQRLAAALP